MKVTDTLQLFPGVSFLLLHWLFIANTPPGGDTVSIWMMAVRRDDLLLAFLIGIDLALLVFPTGVPVPNETICGCNKFIGTWVGVAVGVAVGVPLWVGVAVVVAVAVGVGVPCGV